MIQRACTMAFYRPPEGETARPTVGSAGRPAGALLAGVSWNARCRR
jgi:hypothetical protein